MYKVATIRASLDGHSYYVKPFGRSPMLCHDRKTALQLARAYKQVPMEYPRLDWALYAVGGICAILVGFALL